MGNSPADGTLSLRICGIRMHNYMVDVETSGTSPDRTGIIQLSAVRFDYVNAEVDEDVFDRALLIPPHRFWDEGTRAWWREQKRETLIGILDRAEDPRTVITDFYHWVQKKAALHPGQEPVFWAKPTSFDYSFVQSYCRDYDFPMPFSFRAANDLNSFIRGLYAGGEVPNIPDPPGVSNAHNATWDCFAQIHRLIWAYEDSKSLRR